MNYAQLENKLSSNTSYINKNDDEILQSFRKKFDVVHYNDKELFVFHNQREFRQQNHLISLHHRNSGRVPMHLFHYVVITYVYSGTFTIDIENTSVTLSAGDIIIFDKYVPHSVHPTSENDLGINIILHEHFFHTIFTNKLPNDRLITEFIFEIVNRQATHNHYLVYFTDDDFGIRNCIRNILCEFFDPDLSSADMIDHYIMILIMHLARKKSYDTNLAATNYSNKDLLKNITSYIEQNYVSGNLNELSDSLGYTPSYISRRIKLVFGKTFKQLINEQRMDKAALLLKNSELPIYEIADEVGISNITAFYKRFKDYTSYTPFEYRKQKV